MESVLLGVRILESGFWDFNMDFDKAIETIMELEGGYVNHPNDPGGETNFGISKAAFPSLDIKNLTEKEAHKIYKDNYWDKSQCEKLPLELRLAMFDASINHGNKMAVILLQRTLKVKTDGIIGNITISKAHAYKGKLNLLINFLVTRELFYMNLSTFNHFGKGWSRRLFKIAINSVK